MDLPSHSAGNGSVVRVKIRGSQIIKKKSQKVSLDRQPCLMRSRERWGAWLAWDEKQCRQ